MPDKHFTQIKDELIRSTKLTPHEKAVLFVLLSYGNCKEIFVNQKTLAEQSNTSRASVIRALISLRKQGLVATKMKPDRSTLVYELTDEAVVSQSDNVVAESNKGCVTEQQGVVAESDTSNRSISDTSLVIEEKEQKKIDKIPYKEILEYLNKVTGKNYRCGKKNNEHIRARWNEGHRVDDFKKVIDIKDEEWRDDPKMAKFRRPSTLFGTKFDEYLNQTAGDKPTRTRSPEVEAALANQFKMEEE